MNADFLWTAIVPLGLLAIYALTAITNRDPKPLPGRQPASGPYAPPRPQPPPPLNRPNPAAKPPEIRWAPAPVTKPQMPRSSGNDDDIVIIEPARTGRPVNTRGVNPARKNRSKSGNSSAKSADLNQKKGLADVNQSVNQQIASSMVIKPLTETTVAETVQRNVSGTASKPLDMEGVSIGSGRIAAAFADRAKLREAFILSEILQPPVALRHKRRHF